MAKAEKKLNVVLKKSGKASTKAVVKVKESLAKAKNALIKADSAAKQAEQKAKDISERANELIKIQSAIIQCWSKAVGQLVKPASRTIPDCVKRCRIILPHGSKINDQCACTHVYIIHTFFEYLLLYMSQRLFFIITNR